MAPTDLRKVAVALSQHALAGFGHPGPGVTSSTEGGLPPQRRRRQSDRPPSTDRGTYEPVSSQLAASSVTCHSPPNWSSATTVVKGDIAKSVSMRREPASASLPRPLSASPP